MHWWVTKKKPLKLDRSCACSGQLNCDPVYGDNEQPLPQGLVFRKWKDPGDKVDPVSDETCPHGLRGWTIIFHNAHPHNQNNYHPQKWWKSQEDDNRPLKETLYNYVSSHGQAILKIYNICPPSNRLLPPDSIPSQQPPRPRSLMTLCKRTDVMLLR